MLNHILKILKALSLAFLGFLMTVIVVASEFFLDVKIKWFFVLDNRLVDGDKQLIKQLKESQKEYQTMDDILNEVQNAEIQ